MHYMMVSSDPLISSLRSPQTKKKTALPPGVLNLLVAGDPVRNKEDSQSDHGDEDEVEISQESDSEYEEENEFMNLDSEIDGGEQLVETHGEDSDITLPEYYFSEYDVNFGSIRIEDLDDNINIGTINI